MSQCVPVIQPKASVFQTIRVDRPHEDEPGTVSFTCAFQRKDVNEQALTRAYVEAPEADGRHFVELFPIARTASHILCEGFAWVPPGACELRVHVDADGELPDAPDSNLFEQLKPTLLAFRDLAFVLKDRENVEHTLPLKKHVIKQFDTRPGSELVARQRLIVDLERFGQLNIFVTAFVGRALLHVDIDWSNASFPGPGDVHFRELRLDTSLALLSLLDDPCVGGKDRTLVPAGEHRLSQRRQRPFRLLFWKSGFPWEQVKAARDLVGIGFADWHEHGGFLETGVGAPLSSGRMLDEVNSVYEQQHADFRAVRQPAAMGRKAPPPVSAFWNSFGSRYGGMTGGMDIEQYSGIETAATGSRLGLKRHMIEATRYRCRQMGAIYEDGHPIEPTKHTDANGHAHWRMYNSIFLKSGGKRRAGPFEFGSRESDDWGDDPGVYDTIDDQHDIRQFASTLALVFLLNDPLSRLYLETDEALSRMTWWQGPGHAHRWPEVERGRGVGFGRAEAWNARLVAISHMFSPTEHKEQWLRGFAEVLVESQTPSGLFGALVGKRSKIPGDPPYHGKFYVHRSNEQCYLLFALSGIANVLDKRAQLQPTIRAHVEGLWELAWWHGRGGVIERYAIGTAESGPIWTKREERPKNLPSKPSYPDGFQCGTAIAHGLLFGGAFVEEMLLDYAGATDIADARRKLERLRVYESAKSMSSFGPTLWLLQRWNEQH